MTTPITPTINSHEELTEALAEIEHDQWIRWSQSVSKEVSDERRGRWQAFWVPYGDLTEEVKEHDRRWARKIVALLRQRGLVSEG